MRPISVDKRVGRRGTLSLLLLLLLSVVGAVPSHAASFTYTIDGQPVLLYKIIQWWYDAPATEVPWACGRTLACRSIDPIQVTYVQEERRLSFRFEASFAELVSAVAPETRISAMTLSTTWLDPNYFDAVTAKLHPDPANALGRLWVEGVAPKPADRVAFMANRLEVGLSGPVCGMMDGRIALAHGQDLLKTCPAIASTVTASQPVTLTLRDRHADAILAIFTIPQASADD